MVSRRIGRAPRVTVMATMAACLGLVASAAAPTGQSAERTSDGVLSLRDTAGVRRAPLPGLARPAPGRPSGRVGGELSGACADPAATWLGTRWRTAMRWRFNPASTPGYLGNPSATRATVSRATHNITSEVNPCGLAGSLPIAVRYGGNTRRVAAVRPDGTCGIPDGINEISFGGLAPGQLAVTCLWWRQSHDQRDSSTVEADILVSARPGLFFVGDPAGCRAVRSPAWDLEGTLTHEFGHVFGLGHVTADQHPGLTMSDEFAPCDASHRGLGLGDHDMLRAHY